MKYDSFYMNHIIWFITVKFILLAYILWSELGETSFELGPAFSMQFIIVENFPIFFPVAWIPLLKIKIFHFLFKYWFLPLQYILVQDFLVLLLPKRKFDRLSTKSCLQFPSCQLFRWRSGLQWHQWKRKLQRFSFLT